MYAGDQQPMPNYSSGSLDQGYLVGPYCVLTFKQGIALNAGDYVSAWLYPDATANGNNSTAYNLAGFLSVLRVNPPSGATSTLAASSSSPATSTLTASSSSSAASTSTASSTFSGTATATNDLTATSSFTGTFSGSATSTLRTPSPVGQAGFSFLVF